MFIVFEGIDGSGKTLAAKTLVDELNGMGLPSVYLCDPGSSDLGNKIRELVKYHPCDVESQILLFSASRHELVKEIQRQMAEGKVVVCDRFTLSTICYQGETLRLRDMIQEINDMVAGTLRPDITVYLDVSLSVASQRRSQRSTAEADGKKDNYESDVFLERVLMRYRERTVMSNRPDIVKINGCRTPEQVIADIKREISIWGNGISHWENASESSRIFAERWRQVVERRSRRASGIITD